MFYPRSGRIRRAFIYKHKKQHLFIKNCVFILTRLNFSHLQSTLHSMQYTYRDVFLYCSQQFLNSLIWMPFSASAIFYFTSFTSAKHFSLRTSFILGNKSCTGWFWVNWEGGAQGSCHFWTKTAEYSAQCGPVPCKSPVMKRAGLIPGEGAQGAHTLPLSLRLNTHMLRWGLKKNKTGRSESK